MAVIIVDVCPKCKVDVSRRLGLIKTPLLACRRCGYEMRVTANAVRNNWQYNFAMAAGLFLWFFFACLILLDPRGAAELAARAGRFRGVDNPWVLSLMAFVPAFLIALPCGLMGRLIGIGVARRLLSDVSERMSAAKVSSAPYSSGSASARRALLMDRTPVPPAKLTAPAYRNRRSGRGIGSFLLRVVAGVLWLAAFFVAGSISISLIVMATTEGDHEAVQKSVEMAGKASGVPLFFGSIFLVGVLAKLRWLPGLGRRKTAPQTDAALPAFQVTGQPVGH
jgi:hypothetical protein